MLVDPLQIVLLPGVTLQQIWFVVVLISSERILSY